MISELNFLVNCSISFLTIDGFGWRDRTGVDFTNWAPYYPSGPSQGARCAQMLPLTGRWIDEDCSAGAYFVCAKDKGNLNLCISYNLSEKVYIRRENIESILYLLWK